MVSLVKVSPSRPLKKKKLEESLMAAEERKQYLVEKMGLKSKMGLFVLCYARN